MLAVDTNILVYAHRGSMQEHLAAKHVLKDLAEGTEPWALPWPCVYEFFSAVTNPRIWKSYASTPAQATAQIDAWLSSPTLRLLGETTDYWPILSGFMRRPRVFGPIIHDARIAAICLAHGVEALLTRDRDFSLFPDLPTRNPL